MSKYEDFLAERVELGAGMQAKVYSWNGFAYKCFNEGYPKEWIEYEYNQQIEVCKSRLPIPKYYETEFPNTIKMDLIQGISMFDRMQDIGKDQMMHDFMALFDRIHQVKNLNLHHVVKYLRVQIEKAPADQDQISYAIQCCQEVESKVQEEEVLCHMDYHFLNIMYEGNNPWIIDWPNAKLGKPIWDYARTYVIFYEHAAGLKRNYMKRVLAQQGYSEELFMKAVYASAVLRLIEHDTKRVHQLIQKIPQG